jgi:ABC-type transport system involved in multi-copper enzyme maturation permease subunit
MNATIRPLRFSTLTGIEMRKMTDTRSGRWLLGTILALAAFGLVWKVTHFQSAVWFDNYSKPPVTIIAFLAPILGLLAMTSEWTQRTALTTFTLAPRRLRVITAKFLSSILLSLGLLAVGLVMTFGAMAIGGAVHGHLNWNDLATGISGAAITVVLQVIMGAAFGALAGQTVVAAIAYFVFPLAFSSVSQELFGGVAPWVDVFEAYGRLSSVDPSEHLARTATAITIWVVLPMVIGVVRGLRREIK